MTKKIKHKKKKKLGSYPYLTVVFSITLALFTLGVFGMMLIYGNTLSQNIQNNHKIQVYLQNDLSSSQVNHLKSIIKGKSFANDLIFTTKEEARSKFISNENDDPEILLGYNPLRDFFTITLDAKSSSKEKLPGIKKDIENIRGVYEVEYLADFIETINTNVQKIGIIVLSICFMLVFIVFILINNTIKLALFSQRFIIRSMQLVGATSWFIQKPFLWGAIWQGLLSGWLASTLLFSLSQYAKQKF